MEEISSLMYFRDLPHLKHLFPLAFETATTGTSLGTKCLIADKAWKSMTAPSGPWYNIILGIASKTLVAICDEIHVY